MSDRDVAIARDPFDVAVRVGSALLGLMWIVAALSKAVEPDAAYEFTARVLGGGAGAKAALTIVAAGEALLGVAMLLGAFRGLAVTALALAGATAALLFVRAEAGGKVHCGCMALLSDASVDDALVRNAALLAGVAALFALGFARPRARPGA